MVRVTYDQLGPTRQGVQVNRLVGDRQVFVALLGWEVAGKVGDDGKSFEIWNIGKCFEQLKTAAMTCPEVAEYPALIACFFKGFSLPEAADGADVFAGHAGRIVVQWWKGGEFLRRFPENLRQIFQCGHSKPLGSQVAIGHRQLMAVLAVCIIAFGVWLPMAKARESLAARRD